VPLRPLTLTLGIIWAVVTVAMLLMLPTVNPVMLWAAMSFIAYYFIASFILHARAWNRERQNSRTDLAASI